MALIEMRKLSKHFGGLTAINQLDMEVNQGEIVGLIGPNGAGKTTVFNLITGTLRLSSGKVTFEGKEISGLEPHFVAKRGIARTFQLTTLFPNLTVLENVLVGLQLRSKIGFWNALFNTRSNRTKERELREKAVELLTFVGLANLKDELAKNMPYGHQRVISIAIALASQPKLLLLDEPLCGMNPSEATVMVNMIRGIRDKYGTTIIIVEHNMRAVMSLCERIVVINFGRKIAEGSPEEIRGNQEVINAYLGSQTNAA